MCGNLGIWCQFHSFSLPTKSMVQGGLAVDCQQDGCQRTGQGRALLEAFCLKMPLRPLDLRQASENANLKIKPGKKSIECQQI